MSVRPTRYGVGVSALVIPPFSFKHSITSARSCALFR